LSSKTLEKRNKYGLVWDTKREPEKVVLDCQTQLPALKEIKANEISSGNGDITHILIEGDNYHALSVLNYTHEKSIDVIYIDPPFNTGARDWIYNNNYIDANDAFRHSKWLSFPMTHAVGIIEVKTSLWLLLNTEEQQCDGVCAHHQVH